MLALKSNLRLAADGGAERRVFPRKETRVMVQSRRIDRSVPARIQPELTLALRDLSLGGLSAIVPQPLAKGDRLEVFFPPANPYSIPDRAAGLPPRGWDISGRVVRCESTAVGYRIAVEFDDVSAAA